MQLTITNITSSLIVYRKPIGAMDAGVSKILDVSTKDVEVLSALLTSESAAGHISYSIASDVGMDTDSEYATIADTTHGSRHENGGTDEVSVTGLSGLLANSQTPAAHTTSHENGGSDEISVLGLNGVLADGQTPLAHKTSHQNGGADELSVAGLSGLLADSQTPAAHKTSHENGGTDEISVLGLNGVLADGQTPLTHAASHMRSGADDTLRTFLVFGCAGAPVDTQYLVPGFGAISATEIRLTLPDAMHLKYVRVYCGTAPGGVVDTYTVLVNGAASAAAAAVTGTDVTGTWSGSLAIAANDEISIQATVDAASVAQNVTVSCYFDN